MPRRAPEITQETIDAARKPLAPREKMVYERLTREWQHEGDLGPTAVLENLVEKGWADKTTRVFPNKSSCWLYQRRHSLDEAS